MKRILLLIGAILSLGIGFGQVTIVKNSFESAGDTWIPLTFSTPPCTNGSDQWDYDTDNDLGGIDPASDGTQFWGIRDLQGDCGGPGFETITFLPQNISAYTSVTLSFDYKTQGYDGTDFLGYEIWEDGAKVVDLTNLNKNTIPNWVTVTYNVNSGVSNVYLVLKAQQNGGSDYAGFDNVVLEGVLASGNTVTFDANGGTGTMADQTSGSAANLNPNTFTRTGFTFDEWNTAANGSGTAYADEASFPFSANTTLFAQWTPIPACTEPSQATSLILDNETSSSIDVSFTGSAADNYLVVQSTSATLGANPVDATTYAISDPIGSGTVVYNGSGTSFTAIGLSSSTQYYFHVYPYNDAACSGGPNYTTTALVDDETTLTGPCASESFNNIGPYGGYQTETWTGDDGVSWSATISRTDQTLNGKAITTDGGTLTSGTFTGGIGDLTVSTQRKFSGGTGTFNLNVNGSFVATIPYGASVQTTTINNINVSGNVIVELDLNTGDRVAIDDLSWTCYSSSPEPEINIQGNATDIPDGNTAISTTDDTDFGDVLVSSGSNANTFTIQNVGTADLDITSVVSSNATEFAVSGTTSGTITAGNSATFTITFDPSATGTRTATITIESDDTDEGTYTFDVAGTGTAIPDIVLSSANPAVASSNIVEGSNENVIYAFDLSVSNFDAELTEIIINTSGSFSNSNITNIRAWYSADSTFNAGSDTQLGNNMTNASSTYTTTTFSQTISNGSTGYIFITTDLPCPSTNGNTIIVDAITTADLTFVSGNKSGTAFASGTHTITDDTPTNVSGLATANCENGGVDLSWTDATGCFDNYLVVASLSSLVTAPSGNGISYSNNTIFGSGTSYDDGFVVYKGTATSVSITGLTNGTNYTYTVFTRNGENWSSGVEVDCTPNLVYCNAGPTSSSDSEIENVELIGENNSITNNTTDDCTGTIGGFVNDFTAQSADLGQGNSYNLTVEFGDCNGGGQFDGAGGVWIDWNGDGDFDDIDEEIGTLDVAVSGGNVTENFTINVAISQPVGNYRMRIVQEEGGDAASISPCGTFSWGSVEDYTVEVIIPCTPTHTFTSMLPTSGPEGTEITISGSGFTSSTTASFGSTPANVSFIDASTLIVEVPSGASTGAITLLEAACPIQTSTFTIIEESGTCVSSSGTFTDLFISEVYDGDVNNVWYVELYNPTASPIDLAAEDYEIDRYADLTTTTVSSNADLTGIVPPYSTFVLSLGTSAGTCTGPFDFNTSLSGINEEDRNVLTKGGVDVDEVEFPNQTGYSLRRLASATGPIATYNAADWDVLLIEDCSDLGVSPVLSFSNPTVSSITDASDCDVLDYSVTVTEGDLSTTDDVTYQWYFNDGVSTGWTAVNNTNLIGYTILGEDTNNLRVEGDTNPLSDLDGYQFYCEVIEDGTCENVSNAEKFELQTGRFYRSTATGNWDDAANWEIADSLTGAWTSACVYPTETNSDYISIEATHDITLNLDLNADQIIVQSGASLILDEKLTVANGNTSSADLEVIGTLQDNGATVNGVEFINGATWILDPSGTVIKTWNSSVNSYRDAYETGIANIPASANWVFLNDGSGTIAVASLGMFYPNLHFESTAGNYDANGFGEFFQGSSDYTTVKGDLFIGLGAISGGTGTYKVYNNNLNATPMQILGDVYIENGSAFTNVDVAAGTDHGTGIEVKGSFFIDGAIDYTSGNGIVKLSGTAKQDIVSSGTGVFETYEFELDNPLNAQLNNIDLEITNTLTFTDGVLQTFIASSDKVFIKNQSPLAIVGGSNSGLNKYIDGKLQWITDGSSSYTFPIGRNTGAQAFTIDVTGAAGSEILGFLESNNTPPLYSIIYCDLETFNGGSGQIGSGIGTPDGVLDQIELNQESFYQWNITNPGGGIDEYDISVFADVIQDVFPIQSTNSAIDIRYLMKNGEPGNSPVATSNGAPAFNALGFVACPNQYSLSGLTSFSKFTLNGASASNTLLPVELLYFTAKAKNNNVQIDWATVTEINNDFFTLERSSDGIVFKAIAEVNGAGNTTEQINYQFIDKEPITGFNYYRLKQTDFDGTVSYSQIEAVYFGDNDRNDLVDYSVYPNPFDNIINIMTKGDHKINASIYDVTGKLVRNYEFTQQTKLDVSELAQGAYVLKLIANDNVKTIRLVKD